MIRRAALLALALTGCAHSLLGRFPDTPAFLQRYGSCVAPRPPDEPPLCTGALDSPELRPGPLNSALRIEGSLSKAGIRAIIQRSIVDVRYCYESALGVGALAGRLNVRFVIRPDGYVDPVYVERNETNSEALACCVVDVVEQLRFPPPDGGGIVIVGYPFVFRQGS